jgi:hypothetical protein
MGFEFYGKDRGGGDVDTLRFLGCVFTSDNPYYWRFNAGHDADADLDFTGSTVVNATVTLQSTVTLADMSFTNCPTFTQNGATLSRIKFLNTKVSSASPADAAKISDCEFTSGGSGHAIEIGGSAADFMLNGCKFSGYSGTGADAAIYVNIANGSMTISITGGGGTPSIRTAGATVTVQNTVTVKVTVKDINTGAEIENARVLVEAAAGGDLPAGTDILTGLTNASGIIQTTSFNFTNPQPVQGKARRATTGYGSLYKSSPISGTITAAGLDITILLIPD